MQSHSAFKRANLESRQSLTTSNQSAGQKPNSTALKSSSTSSTGALPTLSLPKGGGAISSIGEKFDVNPGNGTGSFTIKIPTSQSRGGGMPDLCSLWVARAASGQ